MKRQTDLQYLRTLQIMRQDFTSILQKIQMLMIILLVFNIELHKVVKE